MERMCRRVECIGGIAGAGELLVHWADRLRGWAETHLLLSGKWERGTWATWVEGPADFPLEVPERLSISELVRTCPSFPPDWSGDLDPSYSHFARIIARPTLGPMVSGRGAPTSLFPFGREGEAGGFPGVFPDIAADRAGVQMFLRGTRSAPEFVTAHIRVVTVKPRGGDPLIPLRTWGSLWASLAGGILEVWPKDARSREQARGEWVGGFLERFHSGPQGLPCRPSFLRQWPLPPSPPTAGSLPRDGVAHRWRDGNPLEFSSLPWTRHTLVLGATGAGKTQWLSSVAAEAPRHGVPAVIIDLHGDLGPAVVSRLGPKERSELRVLDACRSAREGRVGVDILGTRSPGSPWKDDPDWIDRRVGDILVALRPLSGSTEEWWGPRMERILDHFLRLVLQDGGDLADLADLLNDPVRRIGEALEWVEDPSLSAFLRGLLGLLRRSPDYLASSQNRLARVSLSERIRDLVSPRGAFLDLDREFREGHSVIFRLSRTDLDEASAGFVANLFLARTYQALLGVGSPSASDGTLRSLLILDEAQNYVPSLLARLLEEGRKFGLGVLLATQSPHHWEPRLRARILANLGTTICLRQAPSGDRMALRVLGAGGGSPSERSETTGSLLPSRLPPGWAWARLPGSARPEIWELAPPERIEGEPWKETVETTYRRLLERSPQPVPQGEGLTEILLGVAARKGTAPRSSKEGIAKSSEVPAEVLRRTWVSRGPDPHEIDLTTRGWSRLGLRHESGAWKESREHQELIARAFRIFARHGVRLEIPVQGGLDQRVPDAVARLLGGSREGRRPRSPGDLWRVLERQKDTWLWRLGHGRDVYVEAEVSGCRSEARLLRSWSKARRAGAFLLFLASTSPDGRRLRTFLRSRGIGSDRAEVWVLRPGAAGPEVSVSPGTANGTQIVWGASSCTPHRCPPP
jgi:hypothetical protein